MPEVGTVRISTVLSKVRGRWPFSFKRLRALLFQNWTGSREWGALWDGFEEPLFDTFWHLVLKIRCTFARASLTWPLTDLRWLLWVLGCLILHSGPIKLFYTDLRAKNVNFKKWQLSIPKENSNKDKMTFGWYSKLKYQSWLFKVNRGGTKTETGRPFSHVCVHSIGIGPCPGHLFKFMWGLIILLQGQVSKFNKWALIIARLHKHVCRKSCTLLNLQVIF